MENEKYGKLNKMHETKSGNHSITTTKTSSYYDELTGETTTVSESWSANEKQVHTGRSFSEYWGIGRYFTIICLIIFFIAPVYHDLKESWQWTITSEEKVNGAIVHYNYTNNKTSDDYVELGNNMLSGFVDTMENIGNVVDVSDNVISSFSWVKNIYDNTIGKLVNGVLDFITNIFG